MKERRQGEENTGTRGEHRALRPGGAAGAWREGGRGGRDRSEAGRPRMPGCPGLDASANISHRSACLTSFAGNFLRRISAPLPVWYTWAPGSPLGCPLNPNQLVQRTGLRAALAWQFYRVVFELSPSFYPLPGLGASQEVTEQTPAHESSPPSS